MDILKDDPTIFELNQDVVIEEKSPSKIVIRNKKTGNKTALKDKTDIAIFSKIENDGKIFVESAASDLKIEKSRIVSLLKNLAKRGFLLNTTEDHSLP
jgi:hypothetical protein